MENKGLISSMIGWFRQPFNSQGSALNWVLFVGLLIVAVGLWNFILLEFEREA